MEEDKNDPGHKKSQKAVVMLSQVLLVSLALAVFLTQVVLSRLSDSLLTLADSAHTLSLVVALCPGLILARLPSLSSHIRTRLPAVFSLLSPLLLSSLCLALSLGSVGHLVHPHHSHQPALIFVAGLLGLLFNVTYLSVTRAFHGLCLPKSPQQRPLWHLLLFLLCSLAPSSLLLASSLLLHLFSHPAVHYLDPAFSLVSIAIMVASVYPDIVQNGHLLLQATPPSANLQSLRDELDILCGHGGHHELHVWALAKDHGVATLHVHCSGVEAFKEILSQARLLCKRYGIRELTVQPEFGAPGACALACGPGCAKFACCDSAHSNSHALVLANACV